MPIPPVAVRTTRSPSERFQQPKITFDHHQAIRVDRVFRQCLQPCQAMRAEQRKSRRNDESHRQHAVNAVLQLCSLAHQRGSTTRHLTAKPCGIVRLPDRGQEVTPQQLSHHFGIDFVGLDLRMRNRFRGHGIIDHDVGHIGLQMLHDSPAVRGGFQRHAICRPQELLAKSVRRSRVSTISPSRIVAPARPECSM